MNTLLRISLIGAMIVVGLWLAPFVLWYCTYLMEALP
jgi:hypothetical protein